MKLTFLYLILFSVTIKSSPVISTISGGTTNGSPITITGGFKWLYWNCYNR